MAHEDNSDAFEAALDALLEWGGLLAWSAERDAACARLDMLLERPAHRRSLLPDAT